MSSILEQLCAKTFTANDLHHRIGLLQESLEEILYHQNNAQDTGNIFAEQVLNYIRTIASESDVVAFSQLNDESWSTLRVQNTQDYMTSLRTESESLPVLTLYIPVLFDDASFALVGAWVREHINAGMLIDAIVDPSVVGGCAFVFADTYHDMSLRRAMEKQRGVITQLISSYV